MTDKMMSLQMLLEGSDCEPTFGPSYGAAEPAAGASSDRDKSVARAGSVASARSRSPGGSPRTQAPKARPGLFRRGGWAARAGSLPRYRTRAPPASGWRATGAASTAGIRPSLLRARGPDQPPNSALFGHLMFQGGHQPVTSPATAKEGLP